MDQIDALGPRPDRRAAFGRALLAEAEDPELTAIVQEAARELSTPIALVSLVLDHIQYFKAHVGLPPDLAASRGTERDVSFCQFVVRGGEPFEVSDAPVDERVPQQLVEHYGIRSYLGIPILTGATVVGSLCVIDTEPRSFTDVEREQLARLAARVNGRLAELDRERERTEPSLLEGAAAPALAELREALAPIRSGTAAGLMSHAALGSFFRLARHVLGGGESPAEVVQGSLAAARRALEEGEEGLYNVQAAAGDLEDCVDALEHVLVPAHTARLSEIALSGRELARQNVRATAGVRLPPIAHDPLLSTPRPQGVALVATCLSLVGASLQGDVASSEIRMGVHTARSHAEIVIEADGLDAGAAARIAAELDEHAGKDPTVSVHADGAGVRLVFALVFEGE